MALSLEEVVRQHFGAQQQQRPQQLDANLRRLKAEHSKSRGDEALKQGNYRLAWERYSEAIDLKPDREGLPALHSNRSLAYLKAQRYSDALQDADAAVQLAPGWSKAHWRRGAALLALKRAPEAVLSFLESWKLASGEVREECASRLWQAVQRLTREQVGQGILQLIAALEAEGSIRAPEVEEASDVERSEAIFRRLKEAHKGQPKPGVYYGRYHEWLREGMDPAEAYLQRSAVHTQARCYLQGQADAQAAVAAVLAEQERELLQLEQREKERQGKAAGGQDVGSTAAGEATTSLPLLQQQQQTHAAESDKERRERERRQEARRLQLSRAYFELGEACMAEHDHVDMDCRQAVKAYLRCAELDPSHERVHDKLQEASEKLTGKEMDEIQVEIYHEGEALPTSRAKAPGGLSTKSRVPPGQRVFQAALQLAFPAAKATDCSFKARELLRASVAAAAGVDMLAVSIERVLAPNAARPYLSVLLHVQMGADLLRASELVKSVSCGGGGSETAARGSNQGGQHQLGTSVAACAGASASTSGSCSVESLSEDEDQEGMPRQSQGKQQQQQQHSTSQQAPATAAAAAAPSPADLELQQQQQQQQQLAALLGGELLVAALGLPDPRLCSGEVTDITPACAGASAAERAQQDAINSGEAEPSPEQDRRLVVPSRPKMELEVPYKMYRLTRADGSAVERVDKHPFCMSRVYYNPNEKPEEVWAEIADGSCRWRQTGGEVKILALKVPADLPTRQLGVDIQPYSIKVWNRTSGEVYLEGDLERGVVPEDCFWTHCGGEGEDGCALYLRKMNLEVLQKHWMHNEMWWFRLFKQHREIAWDDYEKDYSDLPEEVLHLHRIVEAKKEPENHKEDLERKRREMLQEADDVRKRTRQERLAELRTGKKLNWVQLNRMLPA